MFKRIPSTILLPLALLALFCGPLSHAENPSPTSCTIVTGDEFHTADGSVWRLEGIKAPMPETPAMAEQSRRTLEKLVGPWQPAMENISTDRYGRHAVQTFVEQKAGARLWLQQEMLRAGMAFVYPPTGDEPDIDKLLAAENEARRAKRGIWADGAYDDTPDTKAWKKIGGFGFISGKVLKAERVKDKVYLNFGDDWRKDFTIAIAAHDIAAFRKANVDPLSYEGKTVRVRGWVIRDYGPMIMVTAPAQIGIISSP